MTKQTRPYVVCHMAPSIDGKIVTNNWPAHERLSAEYNRIAESFDSDAWMVGRVSMELWVEKGRMPRRKAGGRIPRVDFIATTTAKSYAIVLDPRGKIVWKSSAIDGDHVITVLSKRVSDAYLAFLQSKGISYLFSGRAKIDLESVLARLWRVFGIRRLRLEGGGGINGSFLNADLIDELSVLIAPVADGSIGTPTLFDAKLKKGPVRRLKLISVKRRGDFAWLRYKVTH